MYNVYRHLNKNGEIIYIGKSKNLLSRQRSHRDNSSWFDDIDKIEYINLSSKIEMDVAELYLINKYTPINNKKDNRGDSISIVSINEDWIEFNINELKIVKNINNNNIEYIKMPIELISLKNNRIEVNGELKYITTNTSKIFNILFKNMQDNIKNNYLIENIDGNTYTEISIDKILEKLGIENIKSLRNIIDISKKMKWVMSGIYMIDNITYNNKNCILKYSMHKDIINFISGIKCELFSGKYSEYKESDILKFGIGVSAISIYQLMSSSDNKIFNFDYFIDCITNDTSSKPSTIIKRVLDKSILELNNYLNLNIKYSLIRSNANKRIYNKLQLSL